MLYAAARLIWPIEHRGEEFGLLSEAQAIDQLAIAADVLVVEISEEPAARADHFKKASASGVIVSMFAEVPA